MNQLVAMLSSGKGTWAHVLKVIESYQWDSIIIVTNDFGKEKFACNKPFKLVTVDFAATISQQSEAMLNQLRPIVTGFDVGVNFVSGEGKEHMALMSALIKLGVGIRLVALTKDGVKEL